MTVPYQPEHGMEWSAQGCHPTWMYCDLCGTHHGDDVDCQGDQEPDEATG